MTHDCTRFVPKFLRKHCCCRNQFHELDYFSIYCRSLLNPAHGKALPIPGRRVGGPAQPRKKYITDSSIIRAVLRKRHFKSH